MVKKTIIYVSKKQAWDAFKETLPKFLCRIFNQTSVVLDTGETYLWVDTEGNCDGCEIKGYTINEVFIGDMTGLLWVKENEEALMAGMIDA